VQSSLTNKNIEYDLITAGFPCTPFSKAGKMLGDVHPEGNLFKSIVGIIKKYNSNHIYCPIKFLFLENVAYLVEHKNKETWSNMKKELKELGLGKLNQAKLNEKIFVIEAENLWGQTRKIAFILLSSKTKK